MSYAQEVFHEMDQKINRAGVEGSMRLHYGTLNHLTISISRYSITISENDFHQVEREMLPLVYEVKRLILVRRNIQKSSLLSFVV